MLVPALATPSDPASLASPKLRVCRVVPLAAPTVTELAFAEPSMVTVYVPGAVMQASVDESGTTPVDQLVGSFHSPETAAFQLSPQAAWAIPALTRPPAVISTMEPMSRRRRRIMPPPP